MLVITVVILVVGAGLVLIPALAQLAPLGWIAILVGVALLAVLLIKDKGGVDAFMFMPLPLMARALRAVANRLDPEPPHMEAALRLTGWVWNAPLGTYTLTNHTSGAPTAIWHNFTGDV